MEGARGKPKVQGGKRDPRPDPPHWQRARLEGLAATLAAAVLPPPTALGRAHRGQRRVPGVPTLPPAQGWWSQGKGAGRAGTGLSCCF